ncbi:hypothetical protein OJF2_54200 [Aquisphaera giovannonii]|uniref:Uncharacterized protein n=1 Tax=Aquisphaera giovannonii TaxID=406548 RepID=A0A5B9W9R8_9BACT|nr:hypothetical protein [Aquisphaera giovannonii]QEH36835.1 hypothetical protein OJF2_54200 [Aquisphaera giovannonii]
MSQTHASPPGPAEASTVPDPNAMADDLFAVGGAVPFDRTSPEQENVFHTYTGNAIPWIIRGIWIAFWCFAITYFVVFLLPALQHELLTPP